MFIGEIRCDIDNELKLETHMRNMCKKAAQIDPEIKKTRI